MMITLEELQALAERANTAPGMSDWRFSYCQYDADDHPLELPVLEIHPTAPGFAPIHAGIGIGDDFYLVFWMDIYGDITVAAQLFNDPRDAVITALTKLVDLRMRCLLGLDCNDTSEPGPDPMNVTRSMCR